MGSGHRSALGAPRARRKNGDPEGNEWISHLKQSEMLYNYRMHLRGKCQATPLDRKREECTEKIGRSLPSGAIHWREFGLGQIKS